MLQLRFVIILLLCLSGAPLGCGKDKSSSDSSSSNQAAGVADNLQALSPADQALINRGLAYAVELDDLSEKPLSLRDFRGKVVLLTFWATWCVPCIKEMPQLEALYQTLKTENFTVLAINVDPPEARGVVSRFVRDRKVTFPVLMDPGSEIPPEYLVENYPTSFLIGASGEFLPIVDPKTKARVVRLTGERNWSDKEMIAIIRALLPHPSEESLKQPAAKIQ